jgi:cytochrome oxidase assembly protein ShyY1
VHVLGLAAVGAAGTLGAWQYDAWQAHRAAEAVDLTRLEPIPVTEAMGSDDPFPAPLVGRPVEVAGVWVPEGTVLVSGREQDGADGYWVVTPLAVGGAGEPALPVVRGWSPSSAVPGPPAGEAELVGWLQPPEGTGEPDPDPTDDVLPQVRIADLVQHVDQDLYEAYAVATEPGPGLEPATLEQLPEVGRSTALRNLLYAVEWWVFGAFALFIWWRYVQDAAAERSAEEAADEEPTPDPIASDA